MQETSLKRLHDVCLVRRLSWDVLRNPPKGRPWNVKLGGLQDVRSRRPGNLISGCLQDSQRGFLGDVLWTFWGLKFAA